MPEKDRKIKIDKRFRSMFHDKRFKLKCAVDKRGRPVNYTSVENLKKFYALSESDSELSEGDSEVCTEKKKKKKKAKPKEVDCVKPLADGHPRKESKLSKQGADQTGEVVSKLNDQSEGQKVASRTKFKKDSKKSVMEIDGCQGNKDLSPPGENKRRNESGGRLVSVQNKQKPLQSSSAKSDKAPRKDHSLGGKTKESGKLLKQRVNSPIFMCVLLQLFYPYNIFFPTISAIK